jgi:hypothetical protein
VPAGEIEIQILEMVYQIVQRLALSPVVGLVFQVAEPAVAFLPVDVLDRLYDLGLQQRCQTILPENAACCAEGITSA